MTLQRIENVLGDGVSFVELVDALGNDLTVVNAARQSFGRSKGELESKDLDLLRYLGKHQHTAPFRHVQLQFRVKAPEPVAREWLKHSVGAGYVDQPWSELSQRYVDMRNADFYVPHELRRQSQDNKQASEGVLEGVSAFEAKREINELLERTRACYDRLMRFGVAKEQARFYLPFATYTTWVWTASLQATAHFCQLRSAKGAQEEIRKYAKVVAFMAKRVAPNAFAALMETSNGAI